MPACSSPAKAQCDRSSSSRRVRRLRPAGTSAPGIWRLSEHGRAGGEQAGEQQGGEGGVQEVAQKIGLANDRVEHFDFSAAQVDAAAAGCMLPSPHTQCLLCSSAHALSLSHTHT